MANLQPSGCRQGPQRPSVRDPRGIELRVSAPSIHSAPNHSHSIDGNFLSNILLNDSFYSPFGLIAPSKTHPDVVIQAVAARDASRAAQYAAKHGIPEVKTSYQGTFCSRILLIVLLSKSVRIEACQLFIANISDGTQSFLMTPALTASTSLCPTASILSGPFGL